MCAVRCMGYLRLLFIIAVPTQPQMRNFRTYFLPRTHHTRTNQQAQLYNRKKKREVIIKAHTRTRNIL